MRSATSSAADRPCRQDPSREVFERVFGLLSRADQLDTVTRRRLGDAIHFGYGAHWGASYAWLTRRGRPIPW